MNRGEIFYFEILRGIDNYLRQSIINGNADKMAYPCDGIGMCETAAEDLKARLSKYIDSQAKALIDICSSKGEQG